LFEVGAHGFVAVFAAVFGGADDGDSFHEDEWRIRGRCASGGVKVWDWGVRVTDSRQRIG
jgi:hypothetical protein